MFLQEPISEMVFSNESGSHISCSAHGNPTTSVTWAQKDGSPISTVPGLRYNLQYDNHEHCTSLLFVRLFALSILCSSLSNLHKFIFIRRLFAHHLKIYISLYFIVIIYVRKKKLEVHLILMWKRYVFWNISNQQTHLLYKSYFLGGNTIPTYTNSHEIL